MKHKLFVIILAFLFAGCRRESTKSSSVEFSASTYDTQVQVDNTDLEEEAEEDTEEDTEEDFYQDELLSRYDNFEPDNSDVKGVVVYEGANSYYIIETHMGYTIAEWFGGAIPMEGQTIYGQLNNFCMNYFIILNTDSETQLWIEDYWRSKDSALEWLAEHNHLKYYDQSRYDEAKDPYNSSLLFDDYDQLEDY